MDTSRSRHGEFTRRLHPHVPKAWTAHLHYALGFPMDSALSVQLPPGEYELYEHDAIHYELCASREFSVILRVTELDRLRCAGKLTIDGTWP